METQIFMTNMPSRALQWITGVTIGLFCATCIASAADWLPAFMGYSGDRVALAKVNTPKGN